jgi:hypothetical protein
MFFANCLIKVKLLWRENEQKNGTAKGKSIRQREKLTLNRQTLRDLTEHDDSSKRVKGGAIIKRCTGLESTCAAT